MIKHCFSFVALTLLLGVGACVKSGSVRPDGKIPGHLSRYGQLYVQMSSKKPEYQRLEVGLQAAVVQHIEKKQWFAKVHMGQPAGAPGLRMTLQIIDYEGGSKGARAFNMGGEAKIVAQGQLLDNQSQKLLGRFKLEGSSLRESHTSIGPYDTRTVALFDDLEHRAFQSAAQYLVKYLDGKMK